ncbi:MAG: type 2 isopentenyl-diphosphate Delta-isomerase [Candidatus Bathyarchaeota archaeon]
MPTQTQGRKSSHIRICLEEDVQHRNVTTGFEEIYFVHRALPEIERSCISLATTVFNHKFSTPLIVEAMTGGTTEATKINAAIASTVEELGLGMGVGSQRAAIEKPSLKRTFSIARKKAPTAFLIANIGGPQLAKGYGVREAEKAVDMMDADALAIHLNALQEVVQPEGDTNFRGVLSKIGEIAQALDVPVIVKETGAGIAAEDAKQLASMKVAGIDVAGVGGTSWAAVECHRAKKKHDEFRQGLGRTLWDWGIPTAISLIETLQSASMNVIASGGIRTGTDVAKALSLGASLTGLASPILVASEKGPSEVKKTLQILIESLRNVMFLVGAESIPKLKKTPLVITGKTVEWLKMRGFQPEIYAKRDFHKKETI